MGLFGGLERDVMSPRGRQMEEFVGRVRLRGEIEMTLPDLVIMPF